MTDLLSPAEPATGDLLGGRYRLIERVGAGAMGRVYRARDEILGRDVAIKLFHSEETNETDAARKVAEARVLASLDHPSLVTLYDAHVGAADSAYLVMEFVEGTTLRRRLDDGPVAPAEVARMLRDLSAALAVVHAAGIVHRDVKPSNVLLRDGVVDGSRSRTVLADFGVAHLVDSTRLTTPGTVIGTAAYLAPEQVRGEPPVPASDVYALGLLVIEAITGLHPFGAGSLQATVLARLARSPDVPPGLEERWSELLRSMTSLDAGSRPSAAEVAERAATLGTPSGLRRAARRDSATVLADALSSDATQRMDATVLDGEAFDDAAVRDAEPEDAVTRKRLLGVIAAAVAAVVIAFVIVVVLVSTVAGAAGPAPAGSDPTPAVDSPAPAQDPATVADTEVLDGDGSDVPSAETPPETPVQEAPAAPDTAVANVPAQQDTATSTTPQQGPGNGNPNAGAGNNNGNGNNGNGNNGNGNGRDR